MHRYVAIVATIKKHYKFIAGIITVTVEAQKF